MPKKVFLCTDTFIQRRSYYVVANDEEQALTILPFQTTWITTTIVIWSMRIAP
jgi:hypothetical protein